MSGNLLGRETSPYLRQHADNPVHWRPWGPEALAEARRDNKPILLSIGYAACHWCHVMAHESFEDRETAEVMNRLFVNIKVDREERPDIDQISMRALQALGEQGGWPLTMFLSPDAAPIWGGTYFPNTARFGRPAFVDVLRSVAHTFAEDPARVAQNRSALLDFLGQDPKYAETEPTLRSLDEAADLVASVFDPEYGGLRGAPKFPQPALLELMTRSAERTGKPEHRDHVHHTLRTMLQGGIYDHIGGGLARYSVDERWLVPHFEKMLYDNAQLIERLTQAWRQTGEALFRVRIEETVDWLLREIRMDGAFASSLDADSGEGEGSFTVWTPEEVAAVLGPETDQFRRIYDITEGGNFEGRSIPNRIANPGLLDDATEAGLTRMRAQLLQARGKRPRPGRDDKILTDWNGLLIAALASAATHFERRDWLDLAASTYQRLVDTVLVDGRLRHARHGDTVLPVGFASDYGALLKAALALHQATQEQRYLTEASQFADVLDRHYWDQGISAYRLTADDADGLIVRPAPLIDDSIPSANGVIAAGLSRLARLSGTQAYRDRSARILEAHCGAPSEALGKAGLYNALDEHLAGLDIVLIAPQGSNVELLKRAAILHAGEAATLTILADTESLATGHPAAGKTALDERPTAYVCQGNTCSLPVTEPDALVRLLKQRTG